MLRDSEEERKGKMIQHIKELNGKIGHTFYTQYGILIENIPEDGTDEEVPGEKIIGDTTSLEDRTNFLIAFTAASTSSDLSKFFAVEVPFASDENKTHLILKLLSPLTFIFF